MKKCGSEMLTAFMQNPIKVTTNQQLLSKQIALRDVTCKRLQRPVHVHLELKNGVRMITRKRTDKEEQRG